MDSAITVPAAAALVCNLAAPVALTGGAVAVTLAYAVGAAVLSVSQRETRRRAHGGLGSLAGSAARGLRGFDSTIRYGTIASGGAVPDLGSAHEHALPLTLNAVGTASLLVHVPWKPNWVLLPDAIAALKSTFFAVTAVPDWVTVAFHAFATFVSPGKLNVSVQPLIAAVPVFETVTLAVMPPGHSELVAKST